ncbi:MAG TPA: methylated-DNA--[protein]-cysteine S-methyltransferase [Longimicrobiales bacterium]
MSFADQVYRTVARCPRGKVTSYGAVAAMLGRPRAARAVGTALRELPDGSKVPWWRVISSSGQISISGTVNAKAFQRALLEREGVRFGASGKVDWEKYGWSG